MKFRWGRVPLLSFALAMCSLGPLPNVPLSRALLSTPEPVSNPIPAPGKLLTISQVSFDNGSLTLDHETRHHWYSCGEGGQVVVLVHGLGVNSFAFNRVRQLLQQSFRVVCWDRSGFLWSDHPPPGRRLKTAVDHANDLCQLLEACGLTEERVILVGHSFGGVISKEFCRKFPNKSAGLVLVDPTHENGCEHFKVAADDVAAYSYGLAEAFAGKDIPAAGEQSLEIRQRMDDADLELAEDVRRVQHSRPAAFSAAIAAELEGLNPSLDWLRAHPISDLGTLPVYNLIRDTPAGRPEFATICGEECYDALKSQQERTTASMSLQSKLVVAAGDANHFLMVASSDQILKGVLWVAERSSVS